MRVGFYTGPNLLEYEYEIKCVNASLSCDAPGEGVGVTGTLPRAPGYVTRTVSNLLFNTTYWCYALTSTKKETTCQGPLKGITTLPRGGLVSYTLGYQRAPSFFTIEKQQRVCENLLMLSPNGTCVVDSVTSGSARAINSSEVSGSVTYNTYLSGFKLYDDLSDHPSNATLWTLATNVVNSTNDVSVLRVSFDFVQKTDLPGPPEFVMAPLIDQTNATVTWLDGKTGTPEETYTINCVQTVSTSCTSLEFYTANIPRGTLSGTVTGLTPNTTYYCYVIAVNPVVSVCSVPVPITTHASATAPTISSVLAGWISIQVTWAPGLDSVPAAGDPAFFVTCVTSGNPCPVSPMYDVNRPSGSTDTDVISLQGDTSYDCYVVAKNSQGDGVCSNMMNATTACFPGDSMVTTPGGRMQISNLRVGDKVLTRNSKGRLIFEEIYMLGHRDFHSVGLFLHIHTISNATLRLTKDHQIPYTPHADKTVEYGPASDVKVGHYIQVVSQDGKGIYLSKVIAIEPVIGQGYFNPYTMGGNIVVDGIVASCHSSFIFDKMLNTMGISIPGGYQAIFAILRLMYKTVGAYAFQNVQYLIDAVIEIVNHPHLTMLQVIRNVFNAGHVYNCK